MAGYGNNGGDSFALSCILKEKGFDCTVFTVSQQLSDDSAYYAAKVNEARVPVCPWRCSCSKKMVYFRRKQPIQVDGNVIMSR